MLELTVGKSGKEDYYYIQEALDAIAYEEEGIIHIKEGIYREKLFSDKSNLTLIGEGDVLITFSDFGRELMADGLKRGTFRSYTAFFSGHNLKLENLTIENCAGEGKRVGQAVALYLDVDVSYAKNVKLLAHQDTLFVAPLPNSEREKRGFYGPRVFSPRKRNKAVFDSCYIEGTIDFIFGSGDALFINSEIKSIGDGFVTAPSTPQDGIGFVFNNCHFTSNGSTTSVFLMRPWREYGKITILNSQIDSHIEESLWCPWPGREDERSKATFIMKNSNYDGVIKEALIQGIEDDEERVMLELFPKYDV